MKFKILPEYLDRASRLLESDENNNLTYAALELRKAIELIVWTQFIDAFRDHLGYAGMYYIDYPNKLQSQSIYKMYSLLKMHIYDYVKAGSRRMIIVIFSGYNNYLKEIGRKCYIPSELPTSDYKYLSEIIHYEKESNPKNNFPNKQKLLEILKKVLFIKENYTCRVLAVNKDVDNIIPNIKRLFDLSDDKFNTFNAEKFKV